VERVLTGLRAVAEPTRLRLLALCRENELTVSELTQILGQSQPRVSRHLKLLCDGGVLDRLREGNWVFYRLSRAPVHRTLGERLADLLPMDDPVLSRDRARLAEIKHERARLAVAYFDKNARQWNEIRRLHVADEQVEAEILRRVGPAPAQDLLDIGTGTGRMLEILGPRVTRAIGIDASREMLAVARVNLEAAALRNCSVRHADMYHLPFAAPQFDLVVIHQVLHYADRPQAVVAEAARILRPHGRLLIVDFAPHTLEVLRDEQAHRRLGFATQEIAGWLTEAGFAVEPTAQLPGDPLTVTIWSAVKPGLAPGVADGISDMPTASIERAVGATMVREYLS